MRILTPLSLSLSLLLSYSPARAQSEPLEEGGTPFVGHVRYAGSIQGYFDTPLYGFEIEAGFGFRRLPRRFLFQATTRYARYETNWGLDAHRLVIGPLLAWQHDRVLVGIEPGVDVLIVERFTDGGAMVSLGGGADFVLGVDLIRDEAHNALFLGLRAGTRYIPAGLLYGGSLGFGARFGAPY